MPENGNFFLTYPFPQKITFESLILRTSPVFFGGYASVSSLLRVFFRSLSSFLKSSGFSTLFVINWWYWNPPRGMVLKHQSLGTSPGTIPKWPNYQGEMTSMSPSRAASGVDFQASKLVHFWRFVFGWKGEQYFFSVVSCHGFKLFGGNFHVLFGEDFYFEHISSASTDLT